MLVLSMYYPLRLFIRAVSSQQGKKASKQSATNDTFGYQFAGINFVCLADLTTECKPEFCRAAHVFIESDWLRMPFRWLVLNRKSFEKAWDLEEDLS